MEKVYQQYAAKNPNVKVEVKDIEDNHYDNTTTYFDNDNGDNNNTSEEIYSTTTIWFSCRQRRPTIYLPHDLLKKYNMARPCKITLSATKSGILLKFLHPTTYHNNNNNNNNNNS
jgi:hypothetical protein